MHSLDIQCLFVRLSILSTGTHRQQIWVSPHPDSQYIRSILPKHFASRIFKICLRSSGLLHSFSAHGDGVPGACIAISQSEDLLAWSAWCRAVLCCVISTGYLRVFCAENANSFSELFKKGHHGRILDPICGWRELLRASCVLCFWETIEVDHWLCGTCRRIKLLQQCDRSYCNYLQLLISLAGLSDVAAGHW
jgi:hypothetical protein